MFKQLLGRLNRIEEYLCIVLMALTVTVSGAGVIWRFIIRNPFVWTEEISRLFLVWLTFIGMASGVKAGMHMRLEFLEKALPSSGKKILQTVLMLAVAIFSAVIIFTGWRMMTITWATRMPASHWSMGLFYLPLVLSGIFMGARSVGAIITNTRTLFRDGQG